MKAAVPVSLRERNRMRTRQELMEAALDAFASGGLAACTIDAIAKRAGASKTTAYSYYPGGIDEVLRDLYRDIGLALRKEAEEQRARCKTPESRLIALGTALLDTCADPKVGRFFMMVTPALSPLLEPVVGKTSSHFAQMITEDLQLECAQSTETLSACATMIVGAFEAAATAVAADPSKRRVLLDSMCSLIDALLSTLRRESQE